MAIFFYRKVISKLLLYKIKLTFVQVQFISFYSSSIQKNIGEGGGNETVPVTSFYSSDALAWSLLQ